MTDYQRPRTIPAVLPFAAEDAAEGVVRRLAPEDVRPGQFVAVFVVHREAFRVDECTGEIERQGVSVLPEAAQHEFGPAHPGGPAGTPLLVVAVALPFVVVRRPAIAVASPVSEDPDAGPPEPGVSPIATLDLRQVSLAEVGEAYARAFAQVSEAGSGVGDAGGPEAGGLDGDGGDGGDGGGAGPGPGRPPEPPSRGRALVRRLSLARWRE
ncbi:MAG: hypothetical protein RIE77_12755 [Phycisphaerales bacterium]|jgi:hypothetical protein